jgi:hypothetical protein
VSLLDSRIAVRGMANGEEEGFQESVAQEGS